MTAWNIASSAAFSPAASVSASSVTPHAAATLGSDPRFLADELADHLAWKEPPATLCLPLPDGGMLRNTNFRPRFFDPAAEKAGLLGLTPHVQRHTRSQPCHSRRRVKAVELMLGHASAAMTLNIYAGLFADDLDAVADRLDRAFVKLDADQMRTKRRTSRSDQTELPVGNPPERSTG